MALDCPYCRGEYVHKRDCPRNRVNVPEDKAKLTDCPSCKRKDELLNEAADFISHTDIYDKWRKKLLAKIEKELEGG